MLKGGEFLLCVGGVRPHLASNQHFVGPLSHQLGDKEVNSETSKEGCESEDPSFPAQDRPAAAPFLDLSHVTAII